MAPSMADGPGALAAAAREREQEWEDFRGAAGQLTGGIALVITLVAGEPHATTAGSGAVASLAPPLLTVSFARRSRMHVALSSGAGAGKAFTVSLLRAEDYELARRFARPARPSGWPGLVGLDLLRRDPDPPVLRRAVAWFACELEQAIPLGDHICFVGTVVACGRDPAAQPLLYYRGRFHALGAPLAPAPWSPPDRADLSADW